MINIAFYEQIRELYTNYMIMNPTVKTKDYTYKAGDLNVAITADQRNHRQVGTRN